jgi:hypothetical protein
MTNQEILCIAMQQQAVESNCAPEDFTRRENVVVVSRSNENARAYLQLPFFCDLTTFGSNIVASVDERVVDFVQEFINGRKVEHCLETPGLHLLTEEFAKYDHTPCFQSQYFLPDVNVLKELPCAYELRVLNSDDFVDLYLSQWSNALNEKRRHLDILGVGAYDDGKLIGLAACSADCETMWQVGVDVLPEYRQQRIAAALTAKLALEVLARGKVPFYCCAWANMGSVRNALRSGFRPAWFQLCVISAQKTKEYCR